ncbi:hypothetical protein TRM7557_03667 [Tritonibacter multivorans]|uniref:Uncharacterized protein n=1 Tax=Tritonibacter multivorans TaxID=928856 RepID=A0A0P1GJ50_9RHOB|nr:hypothetical protein [Tritonibacter multivorans]MDA7421683.1 hypothetical protein [Tritonibacter multivorans]CUH81942.1 hypothetical protein TRM7557_03667 [Tritonibacter multivorans]SFC91583.1 hypothetical protein SAMN04488049_10511 [Tritonibacter multivorans]
MKNPSLEWRNYASFGVEITAMEKSTAVAEILSGIVCRWGYPINSVIGARVRSLPLRVLPNETGSSEDLDLVFEFKGQDFLEVIARDRSGFPTYGGWLVRGGGMSLGPPETNGFKTLHTFDVAGGSVVHRYRKNVGYCPEPGQALPEPALARLRQQG